MQRTLAGPRKPRTAAGLLLHRMSPLWVVSEHSEAGKLPAPDFRASDVSVYVRFRPKAEVLIPKFGGRRLAIRQLARSIQGNWYRLGTRRLEIAEEFGEIVRRALRQLSVSGLEQHGQRGLRFTMARCICH